MNHTSKTLKKLKYSIVKKQNYIDYLKGKLNENTRQISLLTQQVDNLKQILNIKYPEGSHQGFIEIPNNEEKAIPVKTWVFITVYILGSWSIIIYLISKI
jgi:hypothetical protein